jgi:hypothetical protein
MWLIVVDVLLSLLRSLLFNKEMQSHVASRHARAREDKFGTHEGGNEHKSCLLLKLASPSNRSVSSSFITFKL